jgi:hypothetical protein
LDRAAQRGAAFSLAASNRGRRMGLTTDIEAGVAWTCILALYKPVDIYSRKYSRDILVSIFMAAISGGDFAV